MKHLTTALFASPILIALAPAASAQSTDLAKRDIADIATKWEAAINDRSSSAAAAHNITALFTADGVLNGAGGVEIGPAAIEKSFTASIETNNPTDFHITTSNVQAAGNVAWAYGTVSEKLGGKPVEVFWGAVYELVGGHYKVTMLTGGVKPPPAPPK